MTDISPKRAYAPELRTAVFYTSMFGAAGVTGAYFGIWLEGKGLSASEIGWINSIPVFILLALNIFVGRIADRASDWRGVIVAGSIISGVLGIGFFFADSFWPILIVWTLSSLPFGLVAPVTDAATLRMTRRNGTNFAAIRAWGTVGYMVTLAGTGWLAASYGGGVFVPLLVAVGLVRALFSLGLPRFRAPEGVDVSQPLIAARRVGQVLKPWFIFPLLAFALVQATHMILQAFAALIWLKGGISEIWIGPLLALGALSEVGIMFMFRRLAARMTARHLILICTLVAAVRWAIMAFNPPLWALAILQLTHGITFTFGYLGTMNFIANWTSEDVAAEAQSFAVVIQLGVTVVVVSAFGYLFEAFGAGAFMGAALAALLGAGLVSASLRMVTPREDAE